MSIIRLESVSYSYYARKKRTDALTGISCAFQSGQLYALVGKSGSGKSTLLSLIAHLDQPSIGAIYFDDTNIQQIIADTYRRQYVSVIYQDYNLISTLTVIENVMYPALLAGALRAEAKQNAAQALKSVALEPVLHDRYPNMLSGGEQQRVAIARALCSNARVILADEPTGNLDQENGRIVMDIFSKLAHQSNYCIIMVTHDTDIAALADRTYQLSGGQLVSA